MTRLFYILSRAHLLTLLSTMPVYAYELGQPIDTEQIGDQQANAPCILGQQSDIGGTREIKNKTYIARDYSHTSREFRVSGAGSVLVFNINVDLALKMADSFLSSSVYSTFDYVAGTAYLVGHKFASGITNNLKDGQDLRGRCGNSFIQAITYGDKVVAGLRFEFRSHADKVLFEVDVKPWIGPSLLKIQDSLDKVRNNVKAEIVLRQMRGHVNILSSMELELNKSCASSANDKEGFSPSADLLKCITAYKTALRQIEKSGFPQLINTNSTNQLSELEITTRRYDQVGLWQLQPETKAGVRQSVAVRLVLERIKDKRTQQKNMLAALKHLEASSPQILNRMTEGDRVVFHRSKQIAAENIQLLSETFDRCIEAASDTRIIDVKTKCLDLQNEHLGKKLSKIRRVPWFST